MKIGRLTISFFNNGHYQRRAPRFIRRKNMGFSSWTLTFYMGSYVWTAHYYDSRRRRKREEEVSLDDLKRVINKQRN